MSNENQKVVALLNEIIEMEISGVVRYLHYALMIKGPNRIPIVKWFHDQANEGYQHASMVGEKITALGGHPSLKVSPVPETKTHKVLDILKESLDFEQSALAKYKEVLKHCADDVALEEMIRGMIRLETEHIEEVVKMLDVNT
ncbi:bacterioferritin [Bdellovibrio bacteriovorus]|uniref:Bacterioferritin n=1 Tax=Bdellovibrio bacteriovorus TaxID=959 RepID=A0A150WBP4_BDEBC|nr:ferritin-like domain-containing protein [Bdellovibrio bacteriovorus]KYG60330.1 bacterioferritin [Bdellovibrio bacteriovorus]KYG64333.1 bacterioferritin [Bdellovibrio bacteriovorus]